MYMCSSRARNVLACFCCVLAFMFIRAVSSTYTYIFIQDEEAIDSFLYKPWENHLTTCLTSLSFLICKPELNYILFTSQVVVRLK